MKSFIRYSLAMVFLSSLLPSSYGDRESVHVPTLSAVPSELDSTYSERRRNLQKELDQLKQKSANLQSQEQRDALAAQVRGWAVKAKAFNTELAAAKRAMTGPKVEAPSPGISSEAEIERLKQLRPKLEAELAKVQKWIADGQKDQAEFEKMRKDAEIDFIEDVLKHVPANEAFEHLEKVGCLSHAVATSLKLGYDATIASVSAKAASSSTTDAEKLSQILDAKKSLRDAMTTEAVMKLDPKAKAWLQGIEGVFDATAKELPSGNDKLTALGHVIVGTGTAIYPPAELIVGADAVGEKLGQRVVIQPALTSLNEAIAGEFKAEHYLRQKIAHVDAQIAGAETSHH